jgi:hypothetical protein
MDYLPIQASSVPCERVFSSSAETDTKKRNRISATLMEALQMLKYDFRKRRLTFTQGTKLDARVLMDDEPDDEPELCASGVESLFWDDDVDGIVKCAIREEGDHLHSEVVIADLV